MNNPFDVYSNLTWISIFFRVVHWEEKQKRGKEYSVVECLSGKEVGDGERTLTLSILKGHM